MRKIIIRILLAMTMWLAACDDDSAALQRGLDQLVRDDVAANGFIGEGVSVRLADGRRFASAAGHSDPVGGARYDVDATEQVIGSVTKLYTRVSVDGVTLEGHTGHIDGYNAAALRDVDTGAIIVVSSNDDRAFSGLTAVKVAKFLRDR